MGRVLAFVYGVVAYFAFFGTILYMIGFVGNFVVPKAVDTGMVGATGQSIVINAFLVMLFGVQHSVMARPGFKKWWTKYIPEPIERSTYVLIASFLLMLLFWQWRPLKGIVWNVDSTAGQFILYGLFGLGWATVFLSSFLINHFDLFGLRQVYYHLTGKKYSHTPFKIVFLYRFSRNPLMLGFVIAFWATPLMTTGHLLFVALMTAYIFIGINFEEQTILHFLGDEYRQYREKTPMILPVPKLGKAGRCPFHF